VDNLLKINFIYFERSEKKGSEGSEGSYFIAKSSFNSLTLNSNLSISSKAPPAGRAARKKVILI